MFFVDDDEDNVDIKEDPHMQHVVANDVAMVEPIPLKTKMQVGYADKSSRLWVHHTYAFQRGEVRWLKHASVCRPFPERDPYGEPGPCRNVG